MSLEIYSKDWCPYCAKAKVLLRSEGISYLERDVTNNKEREQEMVERSGRHASINDLAIDEGQRRLHWDLNSARPADHPGLTALGL